MKNILYYIFGLFIIASCTPNQDENGDLLKGVDYETNTNNGGSGTTTRLLKQVKSHTKNEDTGEYEDENYTYNYSGTKLTSYTDASGEVTKFDYNSSNKISKMYNAGQTAVFTYAGTSLTKVVTEITGTAKITADYSYSGGKLSKIISVQDFTIPFPIKAYYETTYEFQGENMMKSVTKNGVYNPVTGDLEMSPEINTVSFTYDSKKSPYKLLPLEYYLCLIGIAPQGGNFLSANNSLKTTVANTGASAEVMSFSHTYDSKNYPVKSTSGEDFIEYKYQD
ncbi:hypothetical protein ACFO4P_03700 [Epilithonimonas pallida]|uniref:YD repeat-containing protein n=1 Tax=Epilithonimonas pallida TaxID=373671 RepID=A0ABY1QZR3_9FLAO|nr:hypothetical protein [Epilithonimonas pallida]SMP90850.1 YD repeat-containing protein [Epilithonimonas pallida]